MGNVKNTIELRIYKSIALERETTKEYRGAPSGVLGSSHCTE